MYKVKNIHWKQLNFTGTLQDCLHWIAIRIQFQNEDVGMRHAITAKRAFDNGYRIVRA